MGSHPLVVLVVYSRIPKPDADMTGCCAVLALLVGSYNFAPQGRNPGGSRVL